MIFAERVINYERRKMIFESYFFKDCQACCRKNVPFCSAIALNNYENAVEETPRPNSLIAFQAYLQRRTKPCPQCHRRIEKNDGCDHMRCLEAAGGCGHA